MLEDLERNYSFAVKYYTQLAIDNVSQSFEDLHFVFLEPMDTSVYPSLNLNLPDITLDLAKYQLSTVSFVPALLHSIVLPAGICCHGNAF